MASTGTGSDSLTVIGEVREGTYGDAVVAIEPGGAEFIPLSERHGNPMRLFFTWVSPNMEFATVFVGVIAVLFFGQSVPMAILAIVLGHRPGQPDHGLLSARGPESGVPQMILSRISFGFFGNALPAGLNAIVAGIGWFAVNSVSGTFALNQLTHIPKLLSLLIVVVAQIAIAFLGHNFLHAFERVVFPFLVVVFVLGGIVIISKSHPGSAAGGGGIGGWLISFGAAFGYAAGWNPYASDYTRYLPPTVSKKASASRPGWASSSPAPRWRPSAPCPRPSRPRTPTRPAPSPASCPRGSATWCCWASPIGAISANAINVYSGTMSFLALGIELPLQLRRAIVAAVVRRDRLPGRLVRPVRRRLEVRELPADHLATGSAPGSASSSSTSGCAAGIGSTASSSTRSTTRGVAPSRCSSPWSSRSGCSPTRPSTSASSRSTCRPSSAT